MKTGDMVRFRKLEYYSDLAGPEEKWEIGLLIEFHKREKMATVLFNDDLLKLSVNDVQKYGKRYLKEKE